MITNIRIIFSASLDDSFDNELYDDLCDESSKCQDVYVDTEDNCFYDDVAVQQNLTTVPDLVSNDHVRINP